MKKITFLVMIIITAIVLSNKSYAQGPGDLYEDFGTDGISTFDYLGLHQYANDLAIQENDKIVVVGSSGSNALVVRFNANGSIDAGFGNNGKVLIDLWGYDGYATSVKIKDDDKIVVAGIFAEDYAFVAQLLPDGSMDNSFSGDGIKEFFSQIDKINDIAVMENGKIVIAGYYYDTELDKGKGTLGRIRPDGSLDFTFGVDGFSYRWYAADNTKLNFLSVDLQDDGKIVAGGSYLYNEKFNCSVFRFYDNGSKDNSFDYTVLNHETKDIWCEDVIVDRNNKIVIGGTVYNSDNNKFDIFMQRVRQNGFVDYDFGADGIEYYNTSTDEELSGICQQSDGKYVFTGTSYSNILVYRIHENGYTDTDFGIDGYVLTNVFGGSNGGTSVSIQDDLNIVIAGYARPPADYSDIAVVKYYSGLYVGQKESITQNTNFNIYPNPIIDHFTINLNKDFNTDTKVQVIDINGSIVFEKRSSIENGIITVNNLKLKKGMYFIKLQTEKEGFVEKLIVTN